MFLPPKNEQLPIAPQTEDLVSADNAHFVNNMLEYGNVISNYLSEYLTLDPAERTFPMPGMVKFIRVVTGFIKETILKDSEIDEASKLLYQGLIDDLSKLGDENYPWNKSFILMHKSVLSLTKTQISMAALFLISIIGQVDRIEEPEEEVNKLIKIAYEKYINRFGFKSHIDQK